MPHKDERERRRRALTNMLARARARIGITEKKLRGLEGLVALLEHKLRELGVDP